MGEISKSSKDTGAPFRIPEEGPVVSTDEVVTTTASSTTVTTVTKTHAEVKDCRTGKPITRDTTTKVEKVERKTAGGVILIETTTSESWVKTEEGTLHFIESESTSQPQPQPGSAGKAAPAPAAVNQAEGKPAASGNDPTCRPCDQPPMITGDDSPSTENFQSPYCEAKPRKSADSHASHNPPPEPPH